MASQVVTVNDALDGHVVLDIECLDRVYLNAYVPILQTSAQVVAFLSGHLAGCFFYGAFVAKVLLVQSRRLPRWALPVAGGALAVAVGVLWYTSALWYYNGYRLPGT